LTAVHAEAAEPLRAFPNFEMPAAMAALLRHGPLHTVDDDVAGMFVGNERFGVRVRIIP